VICAYCQVAIEGPPYRACRSCAAPHHIDCWAEYGGCSIPGCVEAPRADDEPLPLSAPVPAAQFRTSYPAPPPQVPVPPPPPPAPVAPPAPAPPPPPAPAPPPPAPAPPPPPAPVPPPPAPAPATQAPVPPPAPVAPPAPAPAAAPAATAAPRADQPAGRWRWQRPALAAGVAVLLVGVGLAARPLLDPETPRPTADAPATTAPVTIPPATVATGDEPADTGGGASSGAVASAIATIAENGYTADPEDGRIGDTLSVFIGVATDSATAYDQKAFFFVGPELRYIGTDTANPSRGIRVSWSTSQTIALEYKLYRPDDANCCPTGGTAEVRYQWDGLRLTPLDTIPPEQGEGPRSR
jgi:hypothetical protein